MLVLLFAPAELGKARIGGRRLGFFAQGSIDRKFEVQLLAAAVAGHFPVEDRQLGEGRPVGNGDPLARRVDQVTNLVDLQAHAQVTAALEADDQGVVALDRTTVTGDLITA